MTSIIEVIIILLCLLFGGCTTSKVNGIKSQVTIIDRVDPHSLKVDNGRFYSVKIELTNETDTTLNFWTMSCSWQVNWITEDSTLRFYIQCPKNTPKMVLLEPWKKITYDGIIELVDTANFINNKKRKLGFVLIKKNEVHKDAEFRTILYEKIDSREDIYWSEPFQINK